MSKHTKQYLHENQRVGFGHRAWWFVEAIENTLAIASHYVGAVPLAEVRRLLGSVKPVRSSVTHTYTDDNGNTQVVRDERNAGVINSVDGSIFGTFSNGSEWRDFNHDLTDAVSGFVGGIGDLGVQTCGLLDFGARAYLSVGIPETMHDDKSGLDFRPSLMAATALDGSLATTYKRVVTIPLCDNTMAAALAENGEQVKVKHTKNSGIRIKDARHALSLLDESATDFLASVHTLTETPVTDAQWSAFLDIVCPITAESSKHAITHATTRRDALSLLYRNDNRVTPWAGTAFGVLQCANTYRQHIAIRRGAGDDGDRDAVRAERNLSDILSGKSQDADAETLTILSRVLATA